MTPIGSMKAEQIAPVLVLSTGRCGSTMLSDILNTHPEVLSLSEFFASVGMKALVRKRLDGKAMWEIWRRHSLGLKVMLAGGRDRVQYPFDTPQAQFSPHDIPSLLCTTLPHLTPDFESLYDELEPVMQARPKTALADQHRFLFDWLRERLGRRVWVERSGGSLLFGRILTRLFPKARVVHIYRDGRDTALSMSQHPAFRAGPALAQRLRRLGVDMYGGDPLRPFGAFTLLILGLVNVKKLAQQAAGPEACGDMWSLMILSSQAYLSTLSSDQLFSLCYEDVLQSPHEKIRELIDFIDPSLADDAWLDEAARIPRPNPPKYLSLDPETQRRLTRACAPGLEALGYVP